MKIFIATPSTRPFEAEYVASLCTTKGNWIWNPMRNMAVDEARNLLAVRFQQDREKPEYLLFADSDAVWDSDAPLRLAERDLPVVTGMIYRRKLPPVPTIGQYVGKNDKGVHAYEFASTIRKLLDYCQARNIGTETLNALTLPKGEEVDDLIEVDGCGSHFLMVRRDVFKYLRMPYFRCSSPGGGEDFYFCRKVRAAGIPIYADLTVHTGHLVGPGNEFGLRELLSYLAHVQDAEQVIAKGETWEI